MCLAQVHNTVLLVEQSGETQTRNLLIRSQASLLFSFGHLLAECMVLKIYIAGETLIKTLL